jgi:type II secretory pathway pseudopilin PulG
LIELLVVIAIIAILVALLLPAVQQVREAARKSQCQDHLHNICIALHNYESAYKQFVFRKGGTLGYGDGSRRDGNYERLSGMVALLPFVEQKPLYDKFTAADPNPVPIPPGGPAPWANQAAWADGQVEVYRCPSDPATVGTPGAPASRGICNYVFNQGDFTGAANRDDMNVNGVFGTRRTYAMRDIVDGTSNTLAWSERVFANFGIGGRANPDVREGILTNIAAINTNPGACLSAASAIISGGRYTTWTAVKGKASSIWQDGQPEINAFFTILPPNGPSCINDGNGNADGAINLMSASSYHPGGAQAVLLDGKVTFISENIDTGNLGVAASRGGRSPFGVWGALGTRAGGDTARVP